jgi:hypothetical protein
MRTNGERMNMSFNRLGNIAQWRNVLPKDLWDLPAFLLWRRTAKPGKPGKFDKIPFYANGVQRNGANGSEADRARLVNFDAICAAFKRNKHAGIGIALLPDAPFWALDLDDCITTDEEPSTLARRAVATGTYCERSPSGHGVRALFAGKAGADKKNHDAGVELFDSRGFVTLTGDRIGGAYLLPCPAKLLTRLLTIVRAGKRTADATVRADAPPENPALADTVHLPLSMWHKLAAPYAPDDDRSAVALSIACGLRNCGLTPEQILELMSEPEVLAPALDRRNGNTASARDWMYRYVVLPAFQ